MPSPPSASPLTGPALWYVTIHNQDRCKHCDTPALVYDASLEAHAAAFVATCPSGHAPAGTCLGCLNNAGENLYWQEAYFDGMLTESEMAWR